MKKLKIGIIALMFSGMSYAQSVDTLASGIAGKIHFKFDYYTSTIVDKIVTNDFEDITIEIKENQVLYIDLYDTCTCNEYQNAPKNRTVTIYFTDSYMKKHWGTVRSIEHVYERGDLTLKYHGNEVKKVIISKPKNK